MLYCRIMLLLLLLISLNYGEGEEDLRFLPPHSNYKGDLTYTVDTLMVVNFGKKQEELQCPDNDVCFGPNAFDIDENGSIYILNMGILKKYDPKGLFIWEKTSEERIIDFKYCNNRIFLLMAEKLIQVDAKSGKEIKTFNFEHLQVQNYATRNATFFYDKFLFFRDFDPRTFEMKLRYIYDLRAEILSPEIKNDRSFSLVTNCQNCNKQFIIDLFKGLSLTKYIGQSSNYLMYYYSCDPRTQPDKCSEKTGIIFYLMDKQTGTVKALGDYFNKVIGEKFTLLVTRPFVFVNDTTIIFSTFKKKKGLALNQLIYQKLTFKEFN